jgi:hypothetical protein
VRARGRADELPRPPGHAAAFPTAIAGVRAGRCAAAPPPLWPVFLACPCEVNVPLTKLHKEGGEQPTGPGGRAARGCASAGTRSKAFKRPSDAHLTQSLPRRSSPFCLVAAAATMLCGLLKLALVPAGWFGLLVVFTSFLLYGLLQLLCGGWFRTQNLKKRYNAEWALVTGSSSGAPGLPAARCLLLAWHRSLNALKAKEISIKLRSPRSGAPSQGSASPSRSGWHSRASTSSSWRCRMTCSTPPSRSCARRSRQCSSARCARALCRAACRRRREPAPASTARCP